MIEVDKPRICLVLLWHMHQPEYRDAASGEFLLPWVYLHAIKDYSDMAWHLEHHPGIRAVVNFSPVLLDQLEDYADQFGTGDFRDPLLRLLASPDGEAIGNESRALILERAFGPEHDHIVRPFAAYGRLRELFQTFQARGENTFTYLSDQYFRDLLTWFHLCWTGETVRRNAASVTRLMAIGTRFKEGDRRELLKLIGGLVMDIVPRYARLAATGRVEISTSPHFHPIAPLLLGFGAAREADPQVVLPRSPQYPDGVGRMDAQLMSAFSTHLQRFGKPALGVWPAEGGVSSSVLNQLAAHGCKWTASGSGVLNNTLGGAVAKQRSLLYRPYRYGQGGRELALFFRDDFLSDLIAFEYGKWNSHDAAIDFVARIDAVASAVPADETPLVSIILDGENCWGFYPYNGFFFLDRLYSELESHPRISTFTYEACLQSAQAATVVLDRVAAGSWVYGNFTTWIGSPDKNMAWDLLCAAKQSFDLVMASRRLENAAAASRQLGVCEGSDWFWWLGEYNARRTVESFDGLYRHHLTELYRLLELPAPAALLHPIGHGRGESDAGGAMRRSTGGSQKVHQAS